MSTSSAVSSPTPAGASLRLTLAIPSFLSKSKEGEKLLPCVPSWNEVLAMEHWARDKRKKEIQAAFLCALRACAGDSSMRTTSAKNTWSIAADTLACYQTTVQEQRKLRSANARLEKKKQSIPLSKSSPSRITLEALTPQRPIPPAEKKAPIPDPDFM